MLVSNLKQIDILTWLLDLGEQHFVQCSLILWGLSLEVNMSIIFAKSETFKVFLHVFDPNLIVKRELVLLI